MTGDYDFVAEGRRGREPAQVPRRRRHDHLQRRPRPGRILAGGRPRDAQGLPAETAHAPAAGPSDLQRPLPHPARDDDDQRRADRTQPPEVYSIDIGTRAAAILVPGGLGTALSGTDVSSRRQAHRRRVGQAAGRQPGRLHAGQHRVRPIPRPGVSRLQRPDARRRRLPLRRRSRYTRQLGRQPRRCRTALLPGLKDNTGIDVDFAAARR